MALRTCLVCAREKFKKDGEDSWFLSDLSIVEVLTMDSERDQRGRNMLVLSDLLQRSEGGVNAWIFFKCLRALERHTMPKFALANNLWIGGIPSVLLALTIPEQLLIAQHYPRCYIFKLFPCEYDSHILLDQLYSAMAGNASLFEMNTQEVVEMVIGQCMPSPVMTLASVIAITFVGSAKLLVDWLKKMFRVRQNIIYDALKWLHNNNSIYGDIVINPIQVNDFPEDDIPDELLVVIQPENDDNIATRECESYLVNEEEAVTIMNDVNVSNGINEGWLCFGPPFFCSLNAS